MKRLKRWSLILVLAFVLISVLVFVLSLIFGSIALSQPREVEMNGLIIDQTQTKIGQEFFQNFVTFWQAPSGIKNYNYNILVTEMANRWGSWIWIEVNNRKVYGELLKPRSEEIEETAKKGVESVKKCLYQLEEYEKEVSGEEEDMKGTGIY